MMFLPLGDTGSCIYYFDAGRYKTAPGEPSAG